ncbi:MAG: M28 family peptidase [Promethearchaeota archaeon]
MVIRKVYSITIVATITSIIILSIISLPSVLNPSQNFEIDLEFDKNNAYDYVKDQVNLGNRIPGTVKSRDCANYFKVHFKNIDPDFSYTSHNFTIHSTACENVLFKLNPDKKHIVILGAHYDSRAKATKDDTNPNEPIPGANDGASGCAVLMELASDFYDRRGALDCQIWFLFFDAEDQGLDKDYGIDGWDWIEGSTEFVKDLDNFFDDSEEEIDLMILLDMVGGPGLEFINEQYSTSSLLSEIFEVGQNLGYTNEFPSNAITQSITDDHKPFVDAGIPAADLVINFWNNPDWPYHHTTEDDTSHISRTSLERTGKTIEQFIYNLYHKDSDYKSDFPYDEDVDLPPSEIIFIVMIFAIISITAVIIYLIRQNTLKNVIRKELDEKNQEVKID